MDSHTTPAQMRRQRIAELVNAQDAVAGQPRLLAERLASEGILNPATGSAYSASTVRRDVIAEIIGRSTGANNFWYSNRFVYTVDRTRHDYRFWDLFRNGLATGYELVGALANRITQLLAIYILSDAPSYLIDAPQADEAARAYTDGVLARFVTRNHALLLSMLDNYFGLGDQWVIVNPDGSLTLPSPDTVTPIYDPTDYRRLVEVQVRTSDLGIIVWDTYRADGRTVKIQRGSDVQTLVYDNPIGRLPVVQFSCLRRGNELFGRPIYDALLPHFGEYNVLFRKQLGGANVMGNPIPVLEGMENLADTIAANATQEPLQYTDPFGQLVTAPQVAFDMNGLLFVGKGGSAKFMTPPVGFSKDIRDVLYQLFVLMLHHTGLPEVLWGSAVDSTRASAEMQMPPFVRLINAMRVILDGRGADEDGMVAPLGGFFELIDLFLRMRHLTDPEVLVAPVKSMWSSVSNEDDKTRLQAVIYGKGQNLLTDVETLRQLDLVSDPDTMVKDAQAEAQDKAEADQAEFMTRVADEQRALNQAAHQQVDPEKTAPDTSAPKVEGDTLPPLPAGGRRAKMPDGTRVGETHPTKRTNGKPHRKPATVAD